MATGVRLERRGRWGLLILDSPGERLNTLGSASIHDFEHLLDRLESARDLDGLVLASAKPKVFLAGADLDEMVTIERPEAAAALLERGQRVLRRLEDLPLPTVAAIRGAALGGGLEVALACTYRVAAELPETVLGLPEVQLGLLPGLGGCHRLPRRVGLERGLRMLLGGERMGAREALRAGLVDEVVPAERLFHAAVALLARGQRGRPRRGVREWLVAGNPIGRAIVFSAAAKGVSRTTGGHYPAPFALLEAARSGAAGGRERGEAIERARFGELVSGDVSRRLIELFKATREAAQGSAESGGERAALGVLGAGFMGSGIAAAAARAGHPVRLHDAAPAALGRGFAFCQRRFAELVRRRKLTREEARAAAARVVPTLVPRGFGRVEVAIEAVVEDLEVKKALLVELARELPPDALLASNTSTLPIAELARELPHPERVLGLHFFSPVHRMPLVEIVRHGATSEAAVARALAFVRGLGKTPIVVRDGPGFYTSRILSPYLAEAGRLLLAGAGVEAIDAAGRAAGFPVGPLALLDEVGIDVAARAARTMAEAFGARMPYPEPFARLVGAGRLGRKSGHGFYDYSRRRKRPDAETLALLGVPPAPAAGPPEAADRLLFAMTAEAVRCLEEGILASPRDGDLGAVLGLGFPPFRGGPFRFLDGLGLGEAVARLEALAASFGAGFEPPALLRERAARGERFYP